MECMSYIDTDGIPPYAHGLQILLVDDDTMSLTYIASVLEQYSFQVTTTQHASVALSMIREQKDQYELVMANINMSDIDVLSFLHVLFENEIPVVFMSSDMNGGDIARETIENGAIFFLEKPISLEDLKNVWQYAFQKDICESDCEEKNRGKEYQSIEMNEASGVLTPPFGGIKTKVVGALCRPADTEHEWNGTTLVTDLNGNHEQVNTQNTCTLTSKPGQINLADGNLERELGSYNIEELFTTKIQEQRASGIKRLADATEEQGNEKKLQITAEQTESDSSITKKEEGISEKNSNGSVTSDKRRVVWTSDLHLKFTAALSTLGDQKARPRAILKMMDVKNITMRQVASHLQKYKNQVRRICDTALTTGAISLPSVSKSSSFYNRNEFVPATQSSLLYQQIRGTSRFGVGGKPTQYSIPNSLTRSSISAASFNNHDYRWQNLNSRHAGLSRYGDHDTNSPHDFIGTDRWFQNMNQISETSSFAFPYKTDMKEIVKNKQPLGLEESNLKVTENLPGMKYMTSEVAFPNVSAHTLKLPSEPPAVHQKQYCTPALTDPSNSEETEQISTEIAVKTEVPRLQQMNLPRMNYSTPEADSPHISANAFQFPNELAVVTQKQNGTPVVSDPINFETQDQFSTELELLQMDSPSTKYMTHEDASPYKSENTFQLANALPVVNQEQYYAPAMIDPFSSETQNHFSTEVTGTNKLLELLQMDSPSMEYMTHEDTSPYKSANAFQLPNEPLDKNLEQYCTPGLTGPFSSQYEIKLSAGTTELELLSKQIASGNAKNLDNLPEDFNDGRQKLDTTGEAPPAISLNEHQHYTPALTSPFSSQNQNNFSAGTTELELLGKQIASGNATNLEKLPADFNDGRQKLDTITGEAPPAISLNEHQHYTPALTCPFSSQIQNNFSVRTTELELLAKQIASGNANNLEKLPADFNNGRQKLDTITGEAPPAISLNEHQHYTPALTCPFSSQIQNNFSVRTTELELLAKQIASGNANNPEKLPADFNDGRQKLDTITGEAPPAISLNEHQHYTPALTCPFSSQYENKLSAGTTELELLAKQIASGNENNLEKLPEDFNDGRQKLDTITGEAHIAISLNEHQHYSPALTSRFSSRNQNFSAGTTELELVAKQIASGNANNLEKLPEDFNDGRQKLDTITGEAHIAISLNEHQHYSPALTSRFSSRNQNFSAGTTELELVAKQIASGNANNLEKLPEDFNDGRQKLDTITGEAHIAISLNEHQHYSPALTGRFSSRNQNFSAGTTELELVAKQIASGNANNLEKLPEDFNDGRQKLDTITGEAHIAISLNEHQHYSPALTSRFSSRNQNFSAGTTELELVAKQIASGNANNLEKLPEDFNDGRQKLDTITGEAHIAISLNEHQHYSPALTGRFSSRNQNFSAGTTELELVAKQIASGNANNLEKLPEDFNDGRQKLDTIIGEAPPATSLNEHQHYAPALTCPFSSQIQNKFSSGTTELELLAEQIALGNEKNLKNLKLDTRTGDAPPAISSNEHQPLSEYANLLKMLEEDPEEYNSFGNAPYAGNDDYCDWVTRTLFEDSTEQQ